MKRYILLGMITVLTLTVLIACGSSVGDEDSPRLTGTFDPPQLTEPTKHGGGIGWKNDSCYQCHTQEEIADIHSYNPELPESFTKISETDTGVCLYCHGNNGITDLTANDYQCLLCHEDSNILSSSSLFDGFHKHDLNNDGVLSNKDCVLCHSKSDMNGSINMRIDFKQNSTEYQNINDFCLACHDSNGAFGILPPILQFNNDTYNILNTYLGMGSSESEKKLTADVHGIAGGGSMSFGTFRGDYDYNMEISCLSCHEVHSSDHNYLIAKDGSGALYSDNEAKSADVVILNNDFSELCALCHTNDNGSIAGNGLEEVVHESPYSSDCTECHYHGAGYDNGTRQNMF